MPLRDRVTIEWVRTARAAIAHSGEQLAVGDASGDEEHVLALDQLVGDQHTVEVVAGVERLLPFLVVLGPEPALDDATEAS